MENIPATFRKNGTNLLQSLKSNGRVTRGPTGAVLIDGSAVRGSNIIELISFGMRSKKVEAPRGLRQFAHALHTASIPTKFIKNNQLKRAIDEVVSPNASLTATSTPKTSSRIQDGREDDAAESTFLDASGLSSNLITEDESTPKYKNKRDIRKTPNFLANASRWKRLR